MKAIKLAKGLKRAQEKKVVEEFNQRVEAREEAMAKAKAEADFLKPIIKNQFWPLVKDKNIDDASALCQLVSGHIREGLENLKKTTRIDSLGLDKVLKDDELKTLEFLKDLNADQALKIVEGMYQAIEACIRREQKTRVVTELKELTEEFK